MADGTLVLCRHGQSVFNMENRFTGQLESDLTSQGRLEARDAGLHLKSEGIEFDRAFVSPLRRAFESGRIILDTLEQWELGQTVSPVLKERDYGILTGWDKADAEDSFGQERLKEWRKSWRGRPPRGESIDEATERVLVLFNGTILPHVHRGEAVLVTAHGNSLRGPVRLLEELPRERFKETRLEHGIPKIYRLNS